MRGLTAVPVSLGQRSYDVLVGPGARARVQELFPTTATKVAVVTQENIARRWPVTLGMHHKVFFIGDGEKAKSLSTVEQLCRGFSQFGLSRADVVLAVGGGVVTDTAGFAAATYHRGVAVVHVATSLLAQVDAAIGGKTGVNIPEGKNLVGAFWQPTGVVCDTEYLATLPGPEMRCGMGEIAKYHFLADRDEQYMSSGLSIAELVERSVRIKAEVVAGDEFEDVGAFVEAQTLSRRSRAVLNYGHTLAHVIETAGEYGLRHGEAVAVGLIFAAELARQLGRIDDARVDEHRQVVGGYDLPMRVPDGLTVQTCLDLMARDKKAVAGITFVLDGPNGVEVVRNVPSDNLVGALRALGAS